MKTEELIEKLKNYNKNYCPDWWAIWSYGQNKNCGYINTEEIGEIIKRLEELNELTEACRKLKEDWKDSGVKEIANLCK